MSNATLTDRLNRRKIGSVVLLTVGIPFAYVMVTSNIDRGWDWFVRTGSVGLFFAVAMVVSGVYCYFDRPYELVLRVVWSVWFLLVGGTIALFVLLGVALSGSALLFVASLVVTGLIYLSLLGTTALDVYDRVV